MMEVPVTLIVKAPNQQFEDQTIKCELSWTIKRLKGYLSEVYPCKPSTDEQKLIYSGQLLNDTIVLKDVLRQYEEQQEEGYHQTHTVHLVYTPKMNPQNTSSYSNSNRQNNTSNRTLNNPVTQTTSSSSSSTINSTNSDGLRQRNVATNQSVPVSGTTVNGGMTTTTLNYGVSGNSMGNVPNLFDFQQQINTNLAAQQHAMQTWMQNAYSQYLNQYMSLMQMGVRPESIYVRQTPGNVPNFPSFYPPHISNPVISPQSQQQHFQTPIIAPQPPQQSQPPAVQVPEQNDVAQPPQPVAGAAGAAPVPGAEAAPQPRFPHIVQEEQPENRDWLDMFYTMSRLMILLVLVYFYSSPLRCLLVLLIGVTLYLYHMGAFRFNNAAINNIREANNNQRPVANQRNNNAENNNNVPAAGDGAAAAQEQPNVDGENVAAEANLGDQQPLLDNISNPNAEVDAETRSILSFVRSFVVSFITSLVPETPTL